jgi:purine-binding chemotaxis protein CheW
MELSGVAKLDDGSGLIMWMDGQPDERPKLRDVKDSSHHRGNREIGNPQTAAGGQELSEVQLVTFMLGAEEYGVRFRKSRRSTASPSHQSAQGREFIEGITNLRGEVIPVLDTRKRFDLEVKPSDDRTRIIIVDLGGVKTGLVVDSVREVLNLARKDIAPPPEAIGSGIDQQFISGIGKVDAGKRMIVLLDVEKILSRQEQKHLSEVTA